MTNIVVAGLSALLRPSVLPDGPWLPAARSGSRQGVAFGNGVHIADGGTLAVFGRSGGALSEAEELA
jgi:hypothetical protein